jgi:hypothetical protein
MGMWLTYASDHNDMAVLSFSHYGQNCFDYVHIGEEVDLEDLIH